LKQIILSELEGAAEKNHASFSEGVAAADNQILNDQEDDGSAWACTKLYQGTPEPPIGWVYIKLPRPMVINGFGLKSPHTIGDRVPEKFRFLIKMKPNDEQAPSQFDQITNDSEIEYDNLISGFNLVSDIDLKDDKFTKEWQVKKFLFTP